MNKLFLAISLTLICLSALQSQEQQEKELIKEVIQNAYVDGLCNNADEDAIRKGFHADFKVIGAGRDNSVWEFPITDWIEMAKKGKEKGFKYSFQDEYTTVKFLSIDISGKVAVAKIEFYEGSDLNYIDYLTLMRFQDDWKIVSKVFHPVPKTIEEYLHTVIEDYIQLDGDQILDENNNIVIPYSKQGYTLHLPDSDPVATIIMLSGSALDTSRAR